MDSFNLFFQSMIEQDKCPVVICDTSHKIIYMNPAAAENYKNRGGAALVGSSILNCHNEKSAEMIQKVADWFLQDKNNNLVHTFYNQKQNKDIYMVALRDRSGSLIGYYEKHESRVKDTSPFYDLTGAPSSQKPAPR